MPSLPPWYSIALPHSDIREGRLDEAVFAANIRAVRQYDAPSTYLDPEQFFAKTFLTAGLKRVTSKVGQALVRPALNTEIIGPDGVADK